MQMAQVLIVDDSATVRNEVSSFLAANDLSVEVAVDGKDGLDKLQKDSQIKLVISDVNMPNMDGLTMAEKVRSDLGNHGVNIIMLTTESDPRMKSRGKAAGVKGWIVKPFKGDNVVGSIKKLVS
jgi:two-component system chemotaxis response regulator CheY